MSTTKTKELRDLTEESYGECDFALWFARDNLDKAREFLLPRNISRRDKAYQSRIDALETELGILKEQVRVLLGGK